MNKSYFSGEGQAALTDAALVALHASTGLEARHASNHKAKNTDAVIELLVGKKWRRYEVSEQAYVDRFVALSTFKAKMGDSPALLVTSGLSAEMAQRCREMDIQFIDTAGNAFLREEGLWVFVAGMKNSEASSKPIRPRSSNSPAALRMIFVLLSDLTMLNASYRTIADAACIAIGNIGPVFADLLERGFIAQLDGAGRMFGRRDLLLDEWVAGYTNRLRPKLKSRRFHMPEGTVLEPLTIAPGEALWGGEMAAAELTKYLRPVTRTLYVQPARMDDVVRLLVQAGRLRADPQGTLEVVEAFWNMDYLKQGQLAMVPPPLVYADLLGSLEPRNIEVAAMVRQKWIGHV